MKTLSTKYFQNYSFTITYSFFIWYVMISGYWLWSVIIKVGLLTWWNKCDIISLKKTHETRWFLGLTGIGMDFICFWEAEPEIGRNYLDFYLCKDETRNVIACKPGVPYSIAFAYASQFPVIFYSYQDNKNKKKTTKTYFPKRQSFKSNPIITSLFINLTSLLFPSTSPAPQQNKRISLTDSSK